MKRIAILTAGGDTPALNATLFGAVQRANELEVEVYGLMKGFDGMLSERLPHVRLNPLFNTIPELDPCTGGTIIGASRSYIDPNDTAVLKAVSARLERIGIEGLICIGGDGTINGMQPLSELFPCTLAPKTIDNDLGLNHIDEPNEWVREADEAGRYEYRHAMTREDVSLGEIVNYVTPGYATAVYVVAQSIERIRTTAESHRRIAIVEVMGRDSGYIALGAAYGQPDMILIPEIELDYEHIIDRVRHLYDMQKSAVIVIGEGVRDSEGALGAKSRSVDPAGNVKFSGAAERLGEILTKELGDDFFRRNRRHESAGSAIFTRKVGHTQRGGRPILFDRFHAALLGGKALELLVSEQNNYLSTLKWSESDGFTLSELSANKLRDRWGIIHAREVHPSLYDENRFQPSRLGREYLTPIFDRAIGHEDLETIHATLFAPGNLVTRHQSINVEIQKRIKNLD
ncbi:MAG: 6-phosphofructokinase [Planctomycetota bacterium]|jgi:6-phosphofructokinase 1